MSTTDVLKWLQDLEWAQNFNWFAWLTGTVPGALLGYVIGIRMKYVDREIKLQDEHLATIKEAVLEPILGHIKEYYLPVCLLKKGVIARGTNAIKKPLRNVTEDSVHRMDFRLILENPSRDLIGTIGSAAAQRKITDDHSQYYADAKKNHYPELLTRWENFRKKFNDMASQHLAYVEEIRGKLAERIMLPPLIPSQLNQVSYASYESLSIFIYERRLKINDYPLRLDPSANTAQLISDTVLRCQSQKELQKALDIIDAMAKEISAVPVLSQSGSVLGIEANRLIEDFGVALISKIRLHGKCPLL